MKKLLLIAFVRKKQRYLQIEKSYEPGSWYTSLVFERENMISVTPPSIKPKSQQTGFKLNLRLMAKQVQIPSLQKLVHWSNFQMARSFRENGHF